MRLLTDNYNYSGYLYGLETICLYQYLQIDVRVRCR